MTKSQWRRQLTRKMWVNTSGSTADRTTKADDIRGKAYAWKVTKADLSQEWIKARGDIVA